MIKTKQQRKQTGKQFDIEMLDLAAYMHKRRIDIGRKVDAVLKSRVFRRFWSTLNVFKFNRFSNVNYFHHISREKEDLSHL